MAEDICFYDLCGFEQKEINGELVKKRGKGSFIAGEFLSVIPTRITVLPKPGVYKHQVYGNVRITREVNREYVDNFNNEVFQKLVPIDLEHELPLSGAVGYYEPGSGMVEPDGSASFGVRWEERGRQALSEGRFYYFSPEWWPNWQDPLSGKKFKHVLIGGALTTHPYFTDSYLRPLFASEFKFSMENEDKPDDTGKKGDPPEPDADDKKKASMPTCSVSGCDGKIAPDGKCGSCGKSQKASEKKVTEEDPKPTVDPAQFADMRQKFAAMETQIASQNAALLKANEQIARSKANEQRRKFNDIITGRGADDGSKAFRGEVTVHNEVMEAIVLAFGEEAMDDSESLFNRYIASQRSLADQFADGEIFKVKGDSNSKTTTGVDEYEKEIALKMSEQKIDYTAAARIVAKEKPKLFSAHRKAAYAKEEDKE